MAKVLNWLKWVFLAIAGILLVTFAVKEVQEILKIIQILQIDGYVFEVRYVFNYLYWLYSEVVFLVFALCFGGAFLFILLGEKKQKDVGQRMKDLQTLLMIVAVVLLGYFVVDILSIFVLDIWYAIEIIVEFDVEWFEFIFDYFVESVFPWVIKRSIVLVFAVLALVGGIIFATQRKKLCKAENAPNQEVAVLEEKAE